MIVHDCWNNACLSSKTVKSTKSVSMSVCAWYNVSPLEIPAEWMEYRWGRQRICFYLPESGLIEEQDLSCNYDGTSGLRAMKELHGKGCRRQLPGWSGTWRMEIISICGDGGKELSEQSQQQWCTEIGVARWIGFLDPVPTWGWGSPTPANNSQTPAECLGIPLNSDTIYQEIDSFHRLGVQSNKTALIPPLSLSLSQMSASSPGSDPLQLRMPVTSVLLTNWLAIGQRVP